MMIDKAKDAYARWKAVDQAARVKEEELRRAWNVFFEGKTVPPPDELIREVAALRKQAGDLLTEVLQLTRVGGTGS